MILHPAVLALLAGEAAVALLLLVAAGNALSVLRRWDGASASAAQLVLERRTTAVSTLAALALGLQAASLVLLLFTLEDIHPLFTGAMCATGSLNANPLGWAALLVKAVLLVTSALWIGVHRLELGAEGFPLVRVTSAGVLALAPLAVLDLALLLGYFLGLDPEVVTSCCGSLFSAEGSGVAAELAALAPGRARAAFFANLLALVAVNLAARRTPAAAPRLAAGALGALFAPVSIAAVISFVSVGIYRLPGHHCPFDVLQREYGLVGYPLYLGIFGTVTTHLLAAVGVAFRGRPSLAEPLRRAEKVWLRLGLVSALLSGGIAAWAAIVAARME